jgi:hypothetical protein
VKARIQAAQTNRALLAALLDLVQPRETHTYKQGKGGVMLAVVLPSVEAQYASAFRRWDAALDLDRMPLEQVVAMFQAQPEPVVQKVVAALDAWALERRNKHPESEWHRLLKVAERLDKSDRRKELCRPRPSGTSCRRWRPTWPQPSRSWSGRRPKARCCTTMTPRSRS